MAKVVSHRGVVWPAHTFNPSTWLPPPIPILGRWSQEGICLGRERNIINEETGVHGIQSEDFVETGSLFCSEVEVRISGWHLCFSELSHFSHISYSGFLLLKPIRICTTGAMVSLLLDWIWR